ncbi:hypothetical protein DFH27DRAFT_583181, partial [Peziza echinospora]
INLLPYLEVKQGARCPKCTYCAGQINTPRRHPFTPNHNSFEVQKLTWEVNQATQSILKLFDEEYIKGSNDSSVQFFHMNEEVESQWKMLGLNTDLGYLRGPGNGRLKKKQWHRLDNEFEDFLPTTTIAKLREVRLTSDGSMQHAGKLPQLV